jgi:catechol 2,3-dioxygenase-like lactoylglutathione lyase family enzyme
MHIKLTSIMVDDQEKALRFYTEVLGFKKKHDIPVGEYRWITVVSTEGPDNLELALEPNANPAGRTFQEAMFLQGIPLAAFEVTDLARGRAAAREGRGVHARTGTSRTCKAGRHHGHLRQPDSVVPAGHGVARDILNP